MATGTARWIRSPRPGQDKPPVSAPGLPLGDRNAFEGVHDLGRGLSRTKWLLSIDRMINGPEPARVRLLQTLPDTLKDRLGTVLSPSTMRRLFPSARERLERRETALLLL